MRLVVMIEHSISLCSFLDKDKMLIGSAWSYVWTSICALECKCDVLRIRDCSYSKLLRGVCEIEKWIFICMQFVIKSSS